MLSRSDGRGGAYAAAYRLHKGLRAINLDSWFYVADKTLDDPTIISNTKPFPFFLGFLNVLVRGTTYIRKAIDRWIVSRQGLSPYVPFSAAWVPSCTVYKLNKLKSDITHLHWICGSFINIESIKDISAPIVWTLHDMWAFTGGCHFSNGCHKYQESCGHCPTLESNKEADLSRKIWKRKYKHLHDLDITFVTPSTWMEQRIRESSLFKDSPVYTIPNGIDIDIFSPRDKNVSRKQLNLPKDKKLILFGTGNITGDQRKGYQYLIESIKHIHVNGMLSNVALVIFGHQGPGEISKTRIPMFLLGRIDDDDVLARVYSACDVFIVPSLEDNLPNTIMESLSCGTPCVAFDVGGISEMIKHKHNGYLAKPKDITDLAKGIEWTISSDNKYNSISQAARKTVVDNYNLIDIAKRHMELYETVILGIKKTLN